MVDLLAWAAIASALAACVAAWYTYRSTSVARRSLELMRQQEQRRNPNLELYLVDAHIRRNTLKQVRIYAFHMSITNKSDADNSVKELRLAIVYNRGSEPNSMVIIPHDDGLTSYLSATITEPFHIPTPIGSHQSLMGWALFRIDDELLHGAIIESYNLQVLDSHSARSSLEPIILQEISDEEWVAQRNH